MLTIKQPALFKGGLVIALFGLVIAGICGGAWLLWQDRYWTAQAGPTEITLEQLARLKDPEDLPSPWVKVTFDKAVDTGIWIAETRPGVTTTAYKFKLFQVGDRWMVATVLAGFNGNTLDGQIYHSRNAEDLRAFAAIRDRMKEVHGGRLLPFEFRGDMDFGENWTAFPYVVGGCGGFFLLLACGGLHRLAQSFREPSYGSGKYGSRAMFNRREEVLEAELDKSRR